MANFKSAFASARASGKKEFTWNGKRYNTKLADSPAKQKLPAKGPIPAAAPRAKKPAGKFAGVSSDDLARAPAKPAKKAAVPQNKRLMADREKFISTEKKRYNDDLRFQRGK